MSNRYGMGQKAFLISFSYASTEGRKVMQYDTFAEDLAGAQRQAEYLKTNSKWAEVKILGVYEIQDEVDDPSDRVPQRDYRIVAGVPRDEPSDEEV